MRGYNKGAVIPKRDLSRVKPMRFSLIVKLIPETEESKYIAMPESVKRHQDNTRGWFGMIMAVGDAIPKMKKMVGDVVPGAVCLFDESVSIDDPNRCFDWGEDRYVMFDIETLMGIVVTKMNKKNPKNGVCDMSTKIKMLGDRVLVRRPKREDFRITKTKLWVPEESKKQEVGGVVVSVGPGLYNPDRDRYLPMDFKPGDFVLFPKYGATDIKIDGVAHCVIRQDKILAVVEGETDQIQWN